MNFRVENLQFSWGAKSVFKRLQFTAQAGDLIAFQGENGAGKTTLLKILAGLLPLQRGKVLLNSENCSNPRVDYGNHIAYVGHHTGLAGTLTVAECLRWLACLGADELGKQPTYLSAFGLAPYLDMPINELSAGNQRKVLLAARLNHNKPIWILDEPLTALDKASQSVLLGACAEHIAQKGIVFIASHQSLAPLAATHVELMPA